MKLSRLVACVLALAASLPASMCASAAITVTIDSAHPGATINKNVYGQFAEHLGSGIYGGMWVGPDSTIPNTRGWRNDVLGALKELKVPLVRWPGGCFADEYHWKDGIGAREKRPVKVNTNWGGVEENNAVGTHEFFDLVELLGADAYVNGNLGSGSVQEMSEWVEYLTSNSNSTLALLRRQNGHAAPFKVAFFGIGNEAWGCGGDMTPAYYSDLYKHFNAFVKAPRENRPKKIASGGNELGLAWTDVLSRQLKGKTDAISFHYYTIPTGKWDVKGAATGFTEAEWMATLTNTLRMEPLIAANEAILASNDPARKISLFVDEWGTWYDVEKGSNAGFLYQQNTLRDAVVAALNFNIFHAHAERVQMTNIAQMVNVLQAMILTDKERMVLTPTYHVYKMYIPFQGATVLPVALTGDLPYVLGASSIAGISASAARAKDGKVYLSLVNTNPRDSAEVRVDAGTGVRAASGQVLTAARMDAHNTFSDRQAITPSPFKTMAVNGTLTIAVPAKSVLVLALEPSA